MERKRGTPQRVERRVGLLEREARRHLLREQVVVSDAQQ